MNNMVKPFTYAPRLVTFATFTLVLLTVEL